jgi:hypothetical protein
VLLSLKGLFHFKIVAEKKGTKTIFSVEVFEEKEKLKKFA